MNTDDDIEIPQVDGDWEDPDSGEIIRAIVASAVADHYVFPVDRWGL